MYFSVLFRVTIVRDKVTRKSKGVAFVLFLQRDSAHQAVRALNNTQVRNLKSFLSLGLHLTPIKSVLFELYIKGYFL